MDTTITMGQPTKVVIDSAVITHVKCYGGNSGTVTMYAHNGTPPYTYAYNSNTYNTSNLVTGLYAGRDTIHVKDANGCVKDTVITVTQPPLLHFRTPGITQPTCEGFKDGSITIAAFGGAPQYQYSMDALPFKNVTIYSGLAEGAYTFHVVDSNNCRLDSTIVLTGNPHIVIDAPEVSPPSCYGMANGGIALHVSGGIAPLTYHIVKPEHYQQHRHVRHTARGQLCHHYHRQ